MPQDTSSGNSKLPEFLRLVDRVEASRRRDRPASQRELELFISSCTEAEREELRKHFESLIVQDQTVESLRRHYRSRIGRFCNWVQESVGAAALPIARLSQNTVKLVAATLGLGVIGLIQAGQAVWKGAKNLPANYRVT